MSNFIAWIGILWAGLGVWGLVTTQSGFFALSILVNGLLFILPGLALLGIASIAESVSNKK